MWFPFFTTRMVMVVIGVLFCFPSVFCLLFQVSPSKHRMVIRAGFRDLALPFPTVCLQQVDF